MASPSPTNKSSAPAHQDAQPALRPGAPSERILTLARALGRIMATDQDRPEGRAQAARPTRDGHALE